MHIRLSLRLLLISAVVALLFQPFPFCLGEEGTWPVTDENGFLSSGEFIYENPEEGVWRYLSPTLRIEIIRHEDEENRLVWTEADIRTQGSERFRMTPKNAEKRMKRMGYVPDIARENGVVFATSSDFAHLRMSPKVIAGILIRDGDIISDRTWSKDKGRFPNFDTLALFADGDMRVFDFNEHTAEEYLAMGAMDVLAFGPILIRDGVINETMLRKYSRYREPRAAIGMVEKNHYLSIMVEGRHEKSKGITMVDLAQLFADRGCTLAFNLDGGQSATMSFMGKQIIRVGNKKSLTARARTTAEILGIGHSESLEQISQP